MRRENIESKRDRKEKKKIEEIMRKRDRVLCSSTEAQRCEFPGKTA